MYKNISNIKHINGININDAYKISQFSQKTNTILGFRPVELACITKLAAQYPTKKYFIKGKTASWGPQSGLICLEQKFSKLENSSEKIISLADLSIQKSIEYGLVSHKTLLLKEYEINRFVQNNIILQKKLEDEGVYSFYSIAPSHKKYKFFMVKHGNNYIINDNKNSPIQVLANNKSELPITADYDMLLFGIKGEFTYNIEIKIIKQLNLALNKPIGKEVITHISDCSNPHTCIDNNYPATLFLPQKINQFEKISLIKNHNELLDLMEQAKHKGYSCGFNIKWPK